MNFDWRFFALLGLKNSSKVSLEAASCNEVLIRLTQIYTLQTFQPHVTRSHT